MPVVHLSQYDNGDGRPISFTISDGGEAYTIPADVSVMLEATKPDGYGYSILCSKSGNTVTVENYTNQLTAIHGIFYGQLVFTKSDGSRVGAIPISFHVVKAGISDGTVISDSEIAAFVDAMDKYRQLVARFDAIISAETKDAEVIDARMGVKTLGDASRLIAEEIPGTKQSITFASDGSVEKISHIQEGVVIRDDVFTFTDAMITEVRTLDSGDSLTIVTNLETLETEISYTAA